MSIPEGYFKQRYPTQGNKLWLQVVDEADRKALAHAGLVAGEYGKMGGRARAATAVRNAGRFARSDGTVIPYEKEECYE